MGTGFLPHRATTLGLPGMVAAILLVVACVGRRPAGVLLAGILAALLAPFHFYAFPATYLIVGLFVITSGAWRARTIARDAVLFLVPAVLALPYILPVVTRQAGEGSFRFVLGWSEARLAEGPGAVLFFYVTNLGLPVLLAVVAVLVARRMPNRAFLAAWLVTLFLVPNLVVVSAVEFDMNKYFQMMWIAAAVLAAWLIRDWPRPVIAAVLLASAISPALIATWHAWHPAVALDPDPGTGRTLDRAEYAGSRGVRHRRVHQQPGRPRRSAPDHRLRAVRGEPWVRPGAPRGRRPHRVLRRSGRRRGRDGALRRHLRAVGRGRARMRRRRADRLRRE